jgi:hypothetical protein
MKKFWQHPFFAKEKNWSLIYIGITVLISCKIAFLESCDNFDCFRASHFHLIRHLELYIPYPAEYKTAYNYSPFFALLMGLFAWFPQWLGIILWNLANAFCWLKGIQLLPVPSRAKIFMLAFCLVEFVTAAESVQTNATVVAIFLLIFRYLQTQQPGKAAACMAFGIFFKIYVITAAALFLLHPNKLKHILYGLGFCLILFLLPGIFLSWQELLHLYESWLFRMQGQSQRISLSLLGVFAMLQVPVSKELIMTAGTVIMLLLLFSPGMVRNTAQQRMYMGSLLLYTILFNPGVESPTYIIAVAGCCLWYLESAKGKWEQTLMVLVFVFTTLSPTELFPRSVRFGFFVPYHIKAMPCILVWLQSVYDLIRYQKKSAVPLQNG